MISIGPYALSNNVFLAPMAGVTDLPFRKLCRSLGAGMVTGEMTSSQENLRYTEKSKLRGIHADEPLPRSIQIVGWCPDMMASAARYHVEQGASIIDINMGCPAKKVCKKLAGSALLSDPELVARILQKVVQAVDVPVTLKIRTGVDEEHRNGVEIARIAEQSGIALLAVHGRTRAQKYTGYAEFDTVRRIKSVVSIPVIANGDITTGKIAKQIISDTDCDGVMIGRAAHGAPWLPGRIAQYLETGKEMAEPRIEEQGNIALRHIRGLYDFYGEFKGVRIARKHIKWYLSRLPSSQSVSSRINKCDTAKAQIEALEAFYATQPVLQRAA